MLQDTPQYECLNASASDKSDNSDLRLDVNELLASRLPRVARLLPTSLKRGLERLVCQDELNRILDENRHLDGAEFARGALHSLDIKVKVEDADRLPDPSDRRVVFVCNHPLGGLDGMALIDIIQRRYGGQVWFVVNDLLSVIKPLENVFLPINKYGSQSRDDVEAIDRAFEGNDPIIMFPAGMCSRLRKNVPFKGAKCTMVVDLPWQKMFVTKCLQFKRDIIPLYFSGTNSKRFYRAANIREKLGLKFNFEMVYLPSEMVRSKGKSYTLYVGERRSYTSLRGGAEARNYASAIGTDVFMLHPGMGDLPTD